MVNLFYFSKSLNSRFNVAYVVSGTNFCALRSEREVGFLLMGNFLLVRQLTYFNGPNVKTFVLRWLVAQIHPRGAKTDPHITFINI